MDIDPQSLNATLQIVLDFVGQYFWKIVIVVFLFASRKGVAGFIERMFKLSFSYGNASGSVEAVPPTEIQKSVADSTVAQKSKPDQDADSETAEIKEKESEGGFWFPKMQQAFRDGDVDKAKNIFETHQRDEKDADNRHSSEAIFLHLLFTYGNDQTALKKLEELYERSTNDHQISLAAFWLATSFEKIRDVGNTERIWIDAIGKVTDSAEKTTLTTSLAYTYRDDARAELGVRLLEKRLQQVDDTDQRASLYLSLSNLEKELEHPENAAIALEKAVELCPADRDKLFEAAYAESDEDLRLLSILNYQTLLKLDPDHAIAINNLGVCAGRFELNGKQVSLFRQSSEKESTLAMANLAGDLIDKGYWREAQEILDKARTMDSPHKNVSSALVRLQNLRDEESKKWQDLNKTAVIFQKKVRKYGDAVFDSSAALDVFSGAWFTPNGDKVEITGKGRVISSDWSEVRQGLGGSTSKYACAIAGTCRNRSAIISYSRKRTGQRVAGLLGGLSDKSINCYSYLSKDRQRWEIFSRESKEDFSLSLTRTSPDVD